LQNNCGFFPPRFEKLVPFFTWVNAKFIIPTHLPSLFAVFGYFYLFSFLSKQKLVYRNRIEDCLQNQGWVLACLTPMPFLAIEPSSPVVGSSSDEPLPKAHQHNSKRRWGGRET